MRMWSAATARPGCRRGRVSLAHLLAVLGLVTPVLSFPAQALWIALDSGGAAAFFAVYYANNVLRATAIASVAQWVEGRLRWPGLVLVFAVAIPIPSSFDEPLRRSSAWRARAAR